MVNIGVELPGGLPYQPWLAALTVFTDGRPLPDDPTPSWMGYSSSKWSGDTLVIETIGLRDDSWIDWQGSVVTESAKVRDELIDEVCLENERSLQHMK
jgi:hypothetical protein